MEEKVFFVPGTKVIVKHDIGERPIMVVTEKVTKSFKKEDVSSTKFVGIKCMWFTKDLQLQEAIFSSKDLETVE